MSLYERCKDFAFRHIDACAASDIQDLVDFVHSEVGRAASEVLEDTAPVVLYLETEEARAEFIAAIHEAMPGMIARKWP